MKKPMFGLVMLAAALPCAALGADVVTYEQFGAKGDGLVYRSESWLDNRISRNWRAPINRPPLNRDELLDDNDYYDEDYLSSMAADGVNGLWIPVRLEELSSCPSRKAKLASIVGKARNHGIGIWLMMNEPECVAPDDRRAIGHPEWFAPGPVWWTGLMGTGPRGWVLLVV